MMSALRIRLCCRFCEKKHAAPNFLRYSNPLPLAKGIRSNTNNGSHRHHTRNPLFGYIKSLKWVPIPLGVGFAYICYQQYGHIRKRESEKIRSTSDPNDLLAKDWVVRLYKLLPLKALSRLFGTINNIDIPEGLRVPLLSLYVKIYNCNLEEAEVDDLKQYKNLGEFFRRSLKPNARNIDEEHCLVSPSDGRVLHFGGCDMGQVGQVKGITYSLWSFLGPVSWKSLFKSNGKDLDHHEKINSLMECGGPRGSQYQASLKMNPENELYHCIIYLAPGDYHRFHSPTEWKLGYRRYFPGELFSVNPGIARLVRGLFTFNERAVYVGSWKYGFFSMTPVGATNVGSIKIYPDRDLLTNKSTRYPPGSFLDTCFVHKETSGIGLKRGDAFGEFNLGSSIVLVFEAPKDFKFCIEDGETIKVGQALGCVKKYKINDGKKGA